MAGAARFQGQHVTNIAAKLTDYANMSFNREPVAAAF
jgi:hypothetical protein